jgi:hypothetical protein
MDLSCAEGRASNLRSVILHLIMKWPGSARDVTLEKDAAISSFPSFTFLNLFICLFLTSFPSQSCRVAWLRRLETGK